MFLLWFVVFVNEPEKNKQGVLTLRFTAWSFEITCTKCLFVCLSLMPLSTIFQLYRGCQFYWWRKPEDPEKTPDLLQVTVQNVNILTEYCTINTGKDDSFVVIGILVQFFDWLADPIYLKIAVQLRSSFKEVFWYKSHCLAIWLFVAKRGWFRYH